MHGFLFWFFSLLAEEVILAAVTEVAVKTPVGVVERDGIAATLAGDEKFVPAVIAEVLSIVLVGLFFRQLDAAVFTDNCLHMRQLFMSIKKSVRKDRHSAFSRS